MHTQLVLIGIAVAGIVVAAAVAWLRSRQTSPAERERLRRLAVNAAGRIAEGVILDAENFPLAASSPAPDLLFYRYRASGVEYNAAQDVSSLRHLLPPRSCRPGTPVSVKYDPRKPGNSIVLCEEWSGLRAERREILPPGRDTAPLIRGD